MAITVTERAAKEVGRIFVEQKMPADACLRIAVKGGGCSGFSYVLDVTTAPQPEDEKFTSNGLSVVCDPKSYLYVNGTEIDFETDMLNRGFVFNNPNAKSRCGCGSSFRA